MATEMAEDKTIDFTFDGKEPWEEVKLVVHPHLATLVRPMILLLLVWVAIGVLFYFFKASWVTGYAMLGALAFTVFYAAKEIFLWWNTTTIITDYRVVQILQRSLFNREVAATMWSNVQSVTVYTPGVLPSMFGFGMIVCDPGGSEKTVDLFAVPDAYRVQQMALTLMRRAAEQDAAGMSPKERFEKKTKARKSVMD